MRSSYLPARGRHLAGMADLARRLPGILLALLYLGVAIREGDQIATLFETLAVPHDHVVLLATALATALALTALVTRSSPAWRLADAVVFLLPVAVVAMAGIQQGTGGVMIALVGVGTALICYFAVSRLPAPGWRRVILVGTAAVVVWLLLHISIRASPIEFPRQMGSLALGFAFFGLCAVALQVMVYRMEIGLPVFGLLAVPFLLNEQAHFLAQKDWKIYDVNPATPDSDRASVSLEEAFEIWLASRNDLEEYRSRHEPYPVFIVTSEGGGGYAAAHAYLFLSKMQQRCPNFLQHIFAIIGVSGGAIGNSLFWRSLSETNFPDYRGCSGKIDSADAVTSLSNDHLSPVTAALLFQDFPNKILLGALGSWDRTAALIASVSEGAAAGDGRNPYYWNHYWDTSADGRLTLGERPAIIHVATNSVSGQRYVFAPFHFNFALLSGRFEEAIRDLNGKVVERDLNGQVVEEHWGQSDVGFFDSAVASASFPYVTPSLLLVNSFSKNVSLVDGGYIENSGAETAREILLALQNWNDAFDGATIWGEQIGRPASQRLDAKTAECWGLEIETSLRDYKDNEDIPEYDTSESAPGDQDPCRVIIELHTVTIRSEPLVGRYADGQNFFYDPVRALLSARARRGEAARFALLNQQCEQRLYCPPHMESPADWHFYDSAIRPKDLDLPLGWQISRDKIENLAGVVAPESNAVLDVPPVLDKVVEGEEAQWQPQIFDTVEDNPYSIERIEVALDPELR